MKDYGPSAQPPMAQDVWEAFRQNSETIGFRQELKHPLQQRLARWTAPLHFLARTGIVAHIARLAADLAMTIYDA